MPYFVTSEEPGGAEVLAMAESSDECRTLAQAFRAVKAEQLAESRLADATAFRIKHMDAEKAVSACSHLMAELGGLTLGMLPRGAYGGALASAYADAKAAIADMDKGA